MLIKQRNKLFDLQSPKELKFVYVEAKGLGVFADRDFKKGQDVISFPNTLVDRDKSSAEAVQVTEDQFLDTEWLTPEAFINHDCSPNTRLDFRPDHSTSAYAAIKNIKKNEEVTFNYLTTEYDMGSGFECVCGSVNCFHQIRGFRYLTREQQKGLKPLLLPYLQKKIG